MKVDAVLFAKAIADETRQKIMSRVLLLLAVCQ